MMPHTRRKESLLLDREASAGLRKFRARLEKLELDRSSIAVEEHTGDKKQGEYG